MANIVLHMIGSNRISHFVKDCIKHNNDFIGSNCKIYGVKLNMFNYIWTDDDIQKTFDVDGRFTGFDKSVDQVNVVNDNTVITDIGFDRYKAAIKTKERIANMSYSDIDSYVDTIIDLNSAKDVLKVFGKVILAISRQIDYKCKQ